MALGDGRRIGPSYGEEALVEAVTYCEEARAHHQIMSFYCSPLRTSSGISPSLGVTMTAPVSPAKLTPTLPATEDYNVVMDL